MEYKYYTVIVFEQVEQALSFSQSYHISPQKDEENTKYRFAVSFTETQSPCVIVFDLNELSAEDILKVSIKKVNTDFIPLT